MALLFPPWHLGEDFNDLLRQGSSCLLTDQEDTLKMATKKLLN